MLRGEGDTFKKKRAVRIFQDASHVYVRGPIAALTRYLRSRKMLRFQQSSPTMFIFARLPRGTFAFISLGYGLLFTYTRRDRFAKSYDAH